MLVPLLRGALFRVRAVSNNADDARVPTTSNSGLFDNQG